jgi:hypothetical protein
MIPEPGENCFVRTVTDYWLGRIVSIDGPNTVTLTDFAWIPTTGRLGEFLRKGKAENMEVEAAPDGMTIQATGSILSWPHPLLRKTIPANPNE